MKIGFISSYHEKCGISSYTENLVKELISKGVDVKIAANYPKDQLQPDPEYVKRLFHVQFMTDQIGMDNQGILNFFADRDIVHIQLEAALYRPELLIPVLINLRNAGKKLVMTTHTAAIWPEFNPDICHHYISHEQMWSTDTLIPVGVKFFKSDACLMNYKSITSFGLGRNDDSLVLKAIEGTNLKFNPTYGTKEWLPLESLVKKIRYSWIITLLYPEIDNTLSSSAVTLAMGCDRPIIVSNTSWFRHVMDYPNIYVVDGLESLKEIITYLTDINNIPVIRADIEMMKDKLTQDGRTYEDFVQNHVKVYETLLK